MRFKGKLTKWHTDKAFGFIAPNDVVSQVFIHQSAFANKARIPQISDIITFSITKDKAGRYCACDATFLGEKFKKKQPKKINQFSIYLSLIFLATIMITFTLGYLPQKLMSIYIGLSCLTFLSYAVDKSKAQHGAWRTQESTLHMLALIGGWPGAALAQQIFRHKSSKKNFRRVFWSTVMINLAFLLWLYSSSGVQYLQLLT